MKKHTAAIILAYFTLYIVWGSTYLAIRIAVATMPPFYLVGLRFIIAGLGFLALAAVTGRLSRWPTKKEFLSAGFLGLFLQFVESELRPHAVQRDKKHGDQNGSERQTVHVTFHGTSE